MGPIIEEITIDGYSVRITNPFKLMWPEVGIRKLDYIEILIKLTPYIIPHSKDRLLTTIRFPNGVNGKYFFQKNVPDYAPEWVHKYRKKDVCYMLLNSSAELAWLGNQAALEFHTTFNKRQKDGFPSALVFDLDPSEGQTFDQVTEVALIIYETLQSLKIKSWVKTSGATGLQIYIPIGEKYDYELARKINHFFASYFSQKYPDKISMERMVHKRENKIYFDYLQMWHGKTIVTVYSPRATKGATVSMPIEWEELKKGIKPEDFHLLNVFERLSNKGDLFAPMIDERYIQNLDPIITHLKLENV
ncbi:DNA polymerase domain-containing protein [Vulcanibacillus modesticaldus]|uniref:DNA polymerase domain-containing protein n=1 Tax=Vulcanibacillus modesticaldus TaxID=337097 RepID=A0A1D2YTN1_9BACI|nr:non-homologous end-joining DNA ligase [Vulcanibacillus modesticaldus]OEF99063.1 DNA polymerase domain-containing protein [Vulcanibacillus modesticaldus]